VTKLFSFALAMLLLASAMVLPASATAASGPKGPEAAIITGGGKIFGIDYSRLNMGQSRDVKLEMGELVFNGKLMASNAPSMGAVNEIVMDVMREQGISSSDVLNASAMADYLQNAETVDYLDFAKQLPSFIPFGIGTAVMDIFDTIVDANSSFSTGGKAGAMTVLSVLKDNAVNQMGKILARGAVAGGGRVVAAGAKIVPGAGQLLTGLEITLNLVGQQQQFIEVVEFIEGRIALFGNFYGACNRRINDLTGEGTAPSVIRFDNATARYKNITFWGIEGLANTWTVNGELKLTTPYRGSDVEGDYTGTLLIEVDGIDGLDARMFSDHGIDLLRQRTTQMNAWYSAVFHGFKMQDQVDSEASLTRKLTQSFGVSLMVDGNRYLFSDIKTRDITDETTFRFAHTATGYGVLTAPYHSHSREVVETWTSDDLEFVEVYTEKDEEIYINTTPYHYAHKVTHDPIEGTTQFYAVPEGTLWAPLKVYPYMESGR